MADLKVDFAVLEGTKRSLSRLKSEFDTIENRRDDTSDFWGHEEVREAMDEFASNMDHHREDLSNEMEDVGKKVEATIETFQKADEKLKSELEKNTTDEPPVGAR